MTDPNLYRIDFNNVLNKYGVPIVLQFYNASLAGSGYDEPTSWVQSGNNVSGNAFILPLGGDTAGRDYKFMQQGILQTDDRKAFIAGSLLDQMPAEAKVRMVIGSNTWELLPQGIIPYEISGVQIYHQCYIRKIISAY